jgi:hypothetical protein
MATVAGTNTNDVVGISTIFSDGIEAINVLGTQSGMAVYGAMAKDGVEPIT